MFIQSDEYLLNFTKLKCINFSIYFLYIIYPVNLFAIIYFLWLLIITINNTFESNENEISDNTSNKLMTNEHG